MNCENCGNAESRIPFLRHTKHTRSHAPSRCPGHLLHHLLHFPELIEQPVHLIDRPAAPLGNARAALYSDKFRGRLSADHLARAYMQRLFERAANLDKVNQLLYVDLSSYLPECLMTKIDISSMAESLEGL